MWTTSPPTEDRTVPAPPATDTARFPCTKGVALKAWADESYRQRQPLGKLLDEEPPAPRLSPEEFRRLLDEFGKGLNLPVLKGNLSREELYDDDD